MERPPCSTTTRPTALQLRLALPGDGTDSLTLLVRCRRAADSSRVLAAIAQQASPSTRFCVHRFLVSVCERRSFWYPSHTVLLATTQVGVSKEGRQGPRTKGRDVSFASIPTTSYNRASEPALPARDLSTVCDELYRSERMASRRPMSSLRRRTRPNSTVAAAESARRSASLGGYSRRPTASTADVSMKPPGSR